MQGLWKDKRKHFFKDKKNYYTHYKRLDTEDNPKLSIENEMVYADKEEYKTITSYPIYLATERGITTHLKEVTKTELVYLNERNKAFNYYTHQPARIYPEDTWVKKKYYLGQVPCTEVKVEKRSRYRFRRYLIPYWDEKRFLFGQPYKSIYPDIKGAYRRNYNRWYYKVYEVRKNRRIAKREIRLAIQDYYN
jgi:hypothetical protein